MQQLPVPGVAVGTAYRVATLIAQMAPRLKEKVQSQPISGAGAQRQRVGQAAENQEVSWLQLRLDEAWPLVVCSWRLVDGDSSPVRLMMAVTCSTASMCSNISCLRPAVKQLTNARGYTYHQ